MTTQEIANRLVELCRTGDWETAQNELYCNDCTSTEPYAAFGPATVKGMDAIREKGKKWSEMVEQMYGAEVSDPVVADDHFALTMTMDIQYKGGPRTKDAELCVYGVKDGKIVSEQFFYAPPPEQ